MDCYQVLGIWPRSATQEQITTAFKDTVQKFLHRFDMAKKEDFRLPHERERFERWASNIKLAYEVLSDPAKRRQLDENLRRQDENMYEKMSPVWHRWDQRAQRVRETHRRTQWEKEKRLKRSEKGRKQQQDTPVIWWRRRETQRQWSSSGSSSGPIH